MLTVIGDLLQALNTNVRGLVERSVPRPTPLPRPRTALDRARERLRSARMDDLVSEVEDAMKRWDELHGEEVADG